MNVCKLPKVALKKLCSLQLQFTGSRSIDRCARRKERVSVDETKLYDMFLCESVFTLKIASKRYYSPQFTDIERRVTKK